MNTPRSDPCHPRRVRHANVVVKYALNPGVSADAAAPSRFTVRRLMVAVAIIGSALGITGITIERHERFRWIAVHHRDVVPKHIPRIRSSGMEDKHWGLIEWHESVARNYEHAARYPWLPVAPDPPEPN
jgi:hypothetical protein